MENAYSYAENVIEKEKKVLDQFTGEIEAILKNVGRYFNKELQEKLHGIKGNIESRNQEMDMGIKNIHAYLAEEGVSTCLGDIHVFSPEIHKGKEILGKHDPHSGNTSISEVSLQRAIRENDPTSIAHILSHEEMHESFPAPDMYEEDEKILQETITKLYEAWTEKENRKKLRVIAFDAYPEERLLLEEVCGGAGTMKHLNEAMKNKDTYTARIILLRSLEHVRPDLLGGYDPKGEFLAYKYRKGA